MKKGIVALILASILTLSVFSGCGNGGGSSAGKTASGGSSGGTKVIRVAWWGNQVRNNRTAQVLKAYSKTNPGVTFETEFTDWSGYWDKMATQAASNSLPDIISMDYQYLKQYVVKDQLADLTSYVGKSLNLSDALDATVSPGKINGKLYGVSLATTSPALIYDKETVQKAGVTIKNGMTLSEFLDAAKTIKAKTGKGADFCYPNGEVYMEYLVRGQGKVLFTDGKLGIDKSSYVLPFFKLFENGDSYLAPAEVLEASVDAGIEQGPLVTGKAWSTFTTSNQFSAFAAAAKKSLGIATWPVGDNDVQKAMYLKPSMFFCVSNNSDNKEECTKVIDYFVNSTEANDVLLTDRGVPISSKVQTHEKTKVSAADKQLFDYIATIEKDYCSPVNPPSPDGMTEVATQVHKLTEQVLFKKITAQQASDQFYTQANQTLAKAGK